MKLSYDEYLKELYSYSAERLSKVEELLKKQGVNIPYIHDSMESRRKTLGTVEYLLNNNIIESKKNFYKLSLAREWTYKSYDSGEYKIDKEYVTTYVYESLFYVILSGNKERAIHMANLFGGRTEDEKGDHPASKMLGYGLKYVILDDKENAYEYINKLEESKDKRGMKQYNKGYKRVYKGILDRDEKEVNEGLLFLLKNHRASMKRNGNTLEQYFAYDSIALAMIAKDRNINITVNHELLPLEYLDPVDIEYDTLTLFD